MWTEFRTVPKWDKFCGGGIKILVAEALVLGGTGVRTMDMHPPKLMKKFAFLRMRMIWV